MYIVRASFLYSLPFISFLSFFVSHLLSLRNLYPRLLYRRHRETSSKNRLSRFDSFSFLSMRTCTHVAQSRRRFPDLLSLANRPDCNISIAKHWRHETNVLHLAYQSISFSDKYRRIYYEYILLYISVGFSI